MALYDFFCLSCEITKEHSCLIAEREKQTCRTCGNVLKLQFSPPTTMLVPEAFKHSFSELFGTTSEKDYMKANPDLTRINKSTFVPVREKHRRRAARATQTVNEIEGAMRANKTLTAI